MSEAITFSDFGLKSQLLEGVSEAGFVKPTPIQEKTISVVMEGRDVIAQAHTGTGKTAAFGLGAMNRIEPRKGLQLLVIAPTRELSEQVSNELYRLGKHSGLRTATILGGHSYKKQRQSLADGIEIICSTPGRLLDILQSKSTKNFAPSIIVLDEADEMLDLGFLEPVKEIFSLLPQERQTLLFSATMPKKILNLAKDILSDPVTIKTVSAGNKTNVKIKQLYSVMRENERQEALLRLMQFHQPEKSLIFCRTRLETEDLKNTLIAKGFKAQALHGDMEQSQRNQTMQELRNGRAKVLVATDVAARGIDLPALSHVINYHVPYDSNSYVHRIGRTGRGGSEGVAISLVNQRELRSFLMCMQEIKSSPEFREVPTLAQVKTRYARRVRKSLVEAELHADAPELIEKLNEILGEEDAALRLASFILGQRSFTGPESMGVAADEIEELIRRKERVGRTGRVRSKGRGSRGRERYSRSKDSRGGDSRSRDRGRNAPPKRRSNSSSRQQKRWD